MRGRSARGDTLCLLLNAGTRSRSYTLPKVAEPGRWEELLNTARPGPWTPRRPHPDGQPRRPLEPAAATTEVVEG